MSFIEGAFAGSLALRRWPVRGGVHRAARVDTGKSRATTSRATWVCGWAGLTGPSRRRTLAAGIRERGRRIERAARLQLMAMSAGRIQPLDPESARQAHDDRLEPAPLGATFHSFARQVLRGEAECLE